jgi:hypothetical protein
MKWLSTKAPKRHIQKCGFNRPVRSSFWSGFNLCWPSPRLSFWNPLETLIPETTRHILKKPRKVWTLKPCFEMCSPVSERFQSVESTSWSAFNLLWSAPRLSFWNPRSQTSKSELDNRNYPIGKCGLFWKMFITWGIDQGATNFLTAPYVNSSNFGIVFVIFLEIPRIFRQRCLIWVMIAFSQHCQPGWWSHFVSVANVGDDYSSSALLICVMIAFSSALLTWVMIIFRLSRRSAHTDSVRQYQPSKGWTIEMPASFPDQPGRPVAKRIVRDYLIRQCSSDTDSPKHIIRV